MAPAPPHLTAFPAAFCAGAAATTFPAITTARAAYRAFMQRSPARTLPPCRAARPALPLVATNCTCAYWQAEGHGMLGCLPRAGACWRLLPRNGWHPHRCCLASWWRNGLVMDVGIGRLDIRFGIIFKTTRGRSALNIARRIASWRTRSCTIMLRTSLTRVKTSAASARISRRQTASICAFFLRALPGLDVWTCSRSFVSQLFGRRAARRLSAFALMLRFLSLCGRQTSGAHRRRRTCERVA